MCLQFASGCYELNVPVLLVVMGGGSPPRPGLTPALYRPDCAHAAAALLGAAGPLQPRRNSGIGTHSHIPPPPSVEASRQKERPRRRQCPLALPPPSLPPSLPATSQDSAPRDGGQGEDFKDITAPESIGRISSCNKEKKSCRLTPRLGGGG